jgi:hypothetical protein
MSNATARDSRASSAFFDSLSLLLQVMNLRSFAERPMNRDLLTWEKRP